MSDIINGIVFEQDVREIMDIKSMDLEMHEEFNNVLNSMYRGRVINLLNDLIKGSSANYLNLSHPRRITPEHMELLYKFRNELITLHKYSNRIKGESISAVMVLDTVDYFIEPVILSEINPILNNILNQEKYHGEKVLSNEVHLKWYQLLVHLLTMFEHNYFDYMTTPDWENVLQLNLHNNMLSYALIKGNTYGNY